MTSDNRCLCQSDPAHRHPLPQRTFPDFSPGAGKFKSAVKHYQAAAELTDRYVEVLFNIAITLENLGHSTEAVAYYERFVAVAPSGYTIQVGQARLRISALEAPR